MTTDLQSILKKIQALRARAADAASTEAEAEIAARKAAELLAQHNIALTEVDVRADGVERQRWDSGQQTRPVEVFAAFGIETLCNVKIWRTGGVITVLGAPADAATALYFFDIVRVAVRSTWATFQRTDTYWRLRERGQSPRAIGSSFRKGVAIRLGERLAAMAKQPSNASVAAGLGTGGNALVPLKNQLITAWMRDNNVKLQSGGGTSIGSGSGYAAGRAAAEGVSLARGVGAQRAAALLR